MYRNPSGPNARWPPLWFANGCAMNAGPAAPPQRRSNRDATSATTDEARRKRATTVSPDRLVKLTKNRPLAGASGGKAMPSRPCSPPATMEEETSRKSVDSTAARNDADAAALLDDELHIAVSRILERRPQVN